MSEKQNFRWLQREFILIRDGACRNQVLRDRLADRFGKVHKMPSLRWDQAANEQKTGLKTPFLPPQHSACYTFCVSLSVLSDSLWPHGLYPARLLCPWNFPGKNTGVGSHSLLQAIFLTQELKLDHLNCRQILYHLNHQGSPGCFKIANLYSNINNITIL